MHHQVSRHLENYAHIVISPGNEWFKQCVDFFTSNNSNSNVEEISSMVTEQLSLSDFNEIALSCLPPNLNSCENKILPGKYCLQVNTILDVGKSCYSQYNVILKRDTSNTEIGDTKPAPWEPKSHRMLKLMCTDGQQNVMAMEYEPLCCLKEPFIPGFKISIIGPVEYRKGVLLLKSNNVHFIGGEVEHMLIKNAPLNMLCKTLNKPELENPYMFSNVEVENIAIEKQELRNLATIVENHSLPNSRVLQNNTNFSNQNKVIGNEVITYDDFFDEDDDELLYLTQVAEIETQIAQSVNEMKSTPAQTSVPKNNTNVNQPTSSVSKHNTLETKKQLIAVKQTKISDMLGPSTSAAFHSSLVKLPLPKYKNDSCIEKYDLANKQTSGKRVASSPVRTETKKSSVEFHNPEDIWDDIDMDFDDSSSLIKVLKSTSVVKNSKIQVKQNEWICSGIIMDETNQKEVEFSSEVLERLIGVPSKEVLQLKNNHLNCASLKEKIEKGIKGAYRKLHLFKGEMTLTYSKDKSKKPIVTDMIV